MANKPLIDDIHQHWKILKITNLKFQFYYNVPLGPNKRSFLFIFLKFQLLQTECVQEIITVLQFLSLYRSHMAGTHYNEWVSEWVMYWYPSIKQRQEDRKSEEERQKIRKQTDAERKLLIAESNLVWSV